jgi:WD40 repeat protein
MRWVEGLTLNAFVRNSLDKPALLDALAQIWSRMARRLWETNIAHGDLQHGNVLLVPGSKETALAVKLIDYDGMWVSALAKQPSGEVGHPNYQHPQRLREGTYSPEVDRFPLLVVATALRCLRVDGRSLWEKYDNGDNLLFKESDLAAPASSRLFAELRTLRDPIAARLVQNLMAAAQKPLDQTPQLEEVLPEKPPAVTSRVTTDVEPPVQFDFAPGTSEQPVRRKRRKTEKRSALPLVIGGVAAAALVAGALALWLLSGKSPGASSAGEMLVAANPTTTASGATPFLPAPLTTAAKPPPPTSRPAGPGPKDPAPGVNQPALLAAGAFGEVRRIDTGISFLWGAALSPDGAYLIAAGVRGLGLWEAATGKLIRRLEGHRGTVWGVTFSPDGRHALSCGQDRTARLWAIPSGEQQQLFEGHRGEIYAVAFGPKADHVLTASLDGTSRAWSTADSNKNEPLGEANQVGNVLAIAPDGQRALLSTRDKSLCLWDVASRREVRRFTGPTGRPQAIVFAPDRPMAASGDGNTIRRWNLENGAQARVLTHHTNFVQGLAFLRDGRLASCGDDGSVRLWDINTGEELCRFEGHQEPVRTVSSTADGRFIASAGVTGTVRLWHVPPADPIPAQAGKPEGPVYTFTRHRAEVRRCSVSADGRQALTAGLDGSLVLWDLASGDALEQLRSPVPDEGQYVIAFLGGQRALGGSKDRSLRIWDLREGKPIASWPGPREDVYHLACSPDGRWAIAWGKESVALLWDAREGTVVQRLDVGALGASNVALSADGSRAAAFCIDEHVRVWDTATGNEVAKIAKGPHRGEGVALSPDGKLVAAARQEAVGVWELDTGKEFAKLTGHTSDVFAVTFSPDGCRVVSGGTDKSVRVWDLASGKEAAHFTGHEDWVKDVACTPDGHYALSTSPDRTARLWRLPPATLMLGAPLKRPTDTTVVSVPPPDREKPRKLPVPEKTALERALKLIHETFSTEYQKKKTEDRLDLAKRLVEVGKAGNEKPEVRYTALRDAVDIAADAAQVDASIQAADVLWQTFAVDLGPLKIDALERAEKAAKAPAQSKAVAEAALRAADQAAAADEYAAADRFLEVASKISLQLSNVAIHAAARRRKEHFDHQAKEYTGIKGALARLEKEPDAAEANLAVGRFRCLEQEEWDRGLQMLAKGSDAALSRRWWCRAKRSTTTWPRRSS